MNWRNLSLQTKILGIGMLIVASLSLVIFVYLLPAMEEGIVATKREKIRDMVDAAVLGIASLQQEHERKEITAEELQERAVDLVRRMRYGPEGKDYLWINDFTPRMVMHPYKPEMNGKDLSDYRDPAGKALFVEMARILRDRDSGYVDYQWQYKDDIRRIESKVSYVRRVPEMGWIVGTGLYEVDVRSEVAPRIVRLRTTAIIVIAAIALGLVGIVFVLSRFMRRDMQRCVAFAENLAGGDLTARIDLDQRDEVGRLARSLNDAAGKLQRLLADAMASTEQLAQAVEQIASGNENLSQRTSEQASALQEVASTIEEATAAINQNAENAIQARTMTVRGEDVSERARMTVNDAVSAISEMNTAGQKIAEIISVINDIAFQTNLLALNAAVEAARAGEAGRGFAVVAGEVRNLAQRSGGAAKEIEQLIRETVEQVKRSTEMVNRSGEALAGVADVARATAALITEIASASEEQRQGTAQLSVAIGELDAMTQQNASLVEETASASEAMANHARELNVMMGRFTVAVNTTPLVAAAASEVPAPSPIRRLEG